MKQFYIRAYCLVPILVDDEDFERVNKYNWHSAGKGYVKNTKGQLLSRFILGITDPKIFVDHINHNTLDNRRENLRLASHMQNLQNARPRKGQYKGVWWDKPANKWRAQIKHLGVAKNLGRFETAEEAAKVYDAAAKKCFGEFAYLNFPEKIA